MNKNLFPSKFPVIDIGDYVLREQTIYDVQDFFNYFTDPEVNENIISFIPKTLEEARQEIQYWINVFYNGDGVYFAIAKKDTNQMIGSIGFSGINRSNNRIEASYDLAKEFWNKGIMTKALKALLEYGFEEMKFNRIEAFAMKENIASRIIMQKCGFNLEGELKQHRYHNGVYKDIGLFSIVHEDYLNRKQRGL